jgi:hypothetical protein
MKMRQIAMLLVASAAVAGCGSGDETSSYKLVPVNGVVTMNGKPLEGAEVAFTPDGSNAPSTPGSDFTGPEGNYKAMFRGRSGLAPGKYRVIVTKTILPGGDSKNVPEEMKDDPTMLAHAAEARAKAQGRTGKTAEAAPIKIEQVFEREVSATGGPQDFDVKVKATAAAAATESK